MLEEVPKIKSTDDFCFMCVKDNVAHFHHLACIEGAVKTAVLFHILDSIRACRLEDRRHTHAQRTESDGQTGGI